MQSALYSMRAEARMPDSLSLPALAEPMQIGQWLADLLMLDQARPRRCGRMTGPGDPSKYKDIPKSARFTLSNLLDHVRASVTWSCTLDQNGTSYAGVIEIDAGGHDALLRTLATCEARSITAFAFEQLGNDHNGGHVWFLFSEPAPTADIVALCRAIVADAGLPTDTEIWPANQGIRAPFGYHRRNHTRGNLVLQSGELIALDTELTAGFAAVCALPRNSAPVAAPVEPKPERAQSAPKVLPATATARQHASAGRIDTQAIGAAVRAQFNQENEWADLLSEAGGTDMHNGWQCNCGYMHSGTLQIAITSQDKIVSYSPNCRWAPHKDSGKALDKFGFAVAQTYHGNYRTAVEALARQYGLWIEPTCKPTHQVEPPPAASPIERQRRAAENARKQLQRQQAAAARLASAGQLDQAASADRRLYPFARAVLAYHTSCWAAAAAPEHYASVERIARAVFALDQAPTENQVRRLQLAHERLIERGYLVRTVRYTPGEAKTNCWQPPADGGMVIRNCAADADGITMLESSTDSHDKTLRVSEGGAAAQLDSPPPAEAAIARRELLSQVRHLAREVAEPLWMLRDYDEWSAAQLQAEAQRLQTALDQAAAAAAPVEPPAVRVVEPAALETHPEPAEYLATYTEPAIEPSGEYTGGSKYHIPDLTRLAWADETFRLIDLPAASDEPAPQAPPARRRAGRPRGAVSAGDRYRADVALMDECRLAGEIKKHTATLKKHAGAAWLDQVRRKLAIVQAEIDDRAGGAARSAGQLQAGTAPIGRSRAGNRPPSQAQAAPGLAMPHIHQAALFG